MTHRMFFSLLFLLTALALGAQNANNFGFKLGLSTENLDRESVQTDGFMVAIKNANYGFHLGAFGRIRIGEKFHLQPEVLFNSSKVDYKISDLSSGTFDKVVSESYQNLDIPLMAAWQFGFLRLGAGPVGHVHIASRSDIEDEVPDYKPRFENFTLGYLAGAGIDIWRITFDLRYEGNLTRFGDHMYVGGEKIRFSQRLSRWLFSVGYAF